jgi:FkbM family methyltransferase
MNAAELKPISPFERILALGQAVPAALGSFCYRRLKRRYTHRSAGLFDDWVSRLGHGDIAIDLGAHVGVVTERLARTGATVHAFEPDPDAFAILSSRMQGQPNVVLHRQAASDRNGAVILRRTLSHRPHGDRPSKASSIVRCDRKMNLAGGVDVEAVDFAAFLRSLPRPARLVKVDIEGAEWAVLRSVIERALDRFEAMFVETHERFDWSVLPEAMRLQRFAASPRVPYINLFWE